MYQRFIALAVIALILSGSTAFAQCCCNPQVVYSPVVYGYTSYYAPPVEYYSPAPYVSYYAPPAAYYSPAPYVTYYALRPGRALSGLLRGAGLERLRSAPRLRAGRTGAECSAGSHAVNDCRNRSLTASSHGASSAPDRESRRPRAAWSARCKITLAEAVYSADSQDQTGFDSTRIWPTEIPARMRPRGDSAGQPALPLIREPDAYSLTELRQSKVRQPKCAEERQYRTNGPDDSPTPTYKSRECFCCAATVPFNEIATSHESLEVVCREQSQRYQKNDASPELRSHHVRHYTGSTLF